LAAGVTLQELFRQWTERSPADLLLILDQFEEYFLYQPSVDATETFASELARAITDPSLRVNTLVSIREDEIAKLDRFEERIPILFDNMLRIPHLTRKWASLAITGPVAEFNRQSGEEMSIDPLLVAAVLKGVEEGKNPAGQGVGDHAPPHPAAGDDAPVETAYLQLVMTRIWEVERERESRELRESTLVGLNGVKGVVTTHLDQTMEALTEEERQIAAQIFHHLVTSTGAKIAHGVEDLAEYSGVPAANVRNLLNKLSDSRFRILKPAGFRFEIRHDALALAILDWRSRYGEAQKKEEMARREAELQEIAVQERQRAEEQKQLAEAQRQLAVQERQRAEEQKQFAEAQRQLADQERQRAGEQQLLAENQRQLALQQLRYARYSISGAILMLLLLIGLGASGYKYYRRGVELKGFEKARNDAVAAQAKADRQVAEAKQLLQSLSTQVQKQNTDLTLQLQQLEKLQSEEGKLQAQRASAETAQRAANQQLAQAQADAAAARAKLTEMQRQAAELAAQNTDAQAERQQLQTEVASEKKQLSELNEKVTAATSDADAANRQKLISEINTIANAATGKQKSDPNLARLLAVMAFYDGASKKSLTTRLAATVLRASVGPSVPRATLPSEQKPTDIGFLSQELLAVGMDQGPNAAALFQIATGRPQVTLQLPGPVLRVAGNGGLLAVGRADEISLWQPLLTPPKMTGQIRVRGAVRALALRQDGKIQAASSDANKVTVWFGSADNKWDFTAQGTVSAIAFSRDLALLATGCNGSVQVWDISARKSLYTLPQRGAPQDLAFSGDGKFIAAAVGNQALLWKTDSREKPIFPLGHARGANVLSVSFNLDNTLLATGGSDAQALVWATASGKQLLRLDPQNGNVIRVTFSSDGLRLATASADRNTRIWDVPPAAELEQLNSYLDDLSSRVAKSDPAQVQDFEAFTKLLLARSPRKSLSDGECRSLLGMACPVLPKP
jgi:hypothetical protein